MKKTIFTSLIIGVILLSGCSQINISKEVVENKDETLITNQDAHEEANTKTINEDSEIENLLQTYINNDAQIKITYNPDVVGIESANILDLPKESEFGPTVAFGQDDLFADKEYIEKSDIGHKCKPTCESGCAESMLKTSFCEIQKNGDIKGRMEIISSPNDGEWINVRFIFYKGNYKFRIWAYNSMCGREKSPCSLLRRWDGKGKLISAGKIIDAYKNNTELKHPLFNFEKSENEIVDFNKIFVAFKNTLNSIENMGKN